MTARPDLSAREVQRHSPDRIVEAVRDGLAKNDMAAGSYPFT